MRKLISFFIVCVLSATSVLAATITKSSNFTDSGSYSTMYPYMTNKMRQKLNPGTTSDRAQKAISTLVKTGQPTTTKQRSVVPRSAKKTNSVKTSGAKNTYRSATTNTQKKVSSSNSTVKRNVVKRSATKTNNAARSATTQKVVARRGNNSVRSTRVLSTNNTSTTTSTTGTNVSSQRCYSDYSECMDSYCKRENTAYNRCYCSAKLAQIDSKYQSSIDASVQKIIKLKNSSNMSSEEINEYWNQTMGNYVTENSWSNIDNALNIDWSSTESRVRGQNAFNIGHEFCAQHLSNCFYMASNLRDAYKSEISRDCAAYETNLQNLQTVVESLLESYND